MSTTKLSSLSSPKSPPIEQRASQMVEKKWTKSTMEEFLLRHRTNLRKQRRDIQRRYRKKQENRLITLGKETKQLRAEIESLKGQKHAIELSIPTKDTVWNVVVEYFRVFRHGLPSIDPTSTYDTESSVQMDFIKSSMTENIMFNWQRGVDALLQSWSKVTLWFQDVEVTLTGIKKCGLRSVDATTETSVTITEKTLRYAFPHLCKGKMSPIVLKLLNQRIIMPGETRFEWDIAFGRVIAVTAQSDMLMSILTLLGNLEDVSRVFERSLVSPSFQLC
ncbi:hypothetical protein PHMEG_0005696 [Phytophthora megakarya]|uniref:Bzip transcription factor n=1 Tax=Phytophthora megakarya TaxID=4795 RepID=A0A225WQH0_9STRA|nr:hypothetical protein PHMEG_0005696 [Phytophthora megakarya]